MSPAPTATVVGIAAVALLSACSGSTGPTRPTVCSAFGGPPAVSALAVGLVGEPATLTLLDSCGRIPTDVESVQATISDPSGQTKPIEVSRATGDGEERFQVSVVPTEPGRYTIRAVLEPNLGTLTNYFEAARPAANTTLTTLPAVCLRVVALGPELLSCDGQVYALDGGLRAVLPTTLAVAGEAIWAAYSHDDGGVDVWRYVLDGGGLTLTAQRRVGHHGFLSVHAREDLLVAAGGTELMLFSLAEDGGLNQSDFTDAGNRSLYALASEDGGIFVHRSRVESYVAPRGTPDGDFCRLLEDGGADRCAPQFGSYAGTSHSALYFLDSSASDWTLSKLDVSTGTPRVSRITFWDGTLNLPHSTGLPLDQRVPGYRLPSGLAVFPARGGGELSLEALRLAPADELPLISDDLLWWPAPLYGVTLIRRRE